VSLLEADGGTPFAFRVWAENWALLHTLR
jgi:hypothetical protein